MLHHAQKIVLRNKIRKTLHETEVRKRIQVLENLLKKALFIKYSKQHKELL